MPYQASSYQNSPRPVGQATQGGHTQHQPGSRRDVKGGAAGGGVAHGAAPFTTRSESGLSGEQRLLVLPGIGGGVGGHPPRLEPTRDSATGAHHTPVAPDSDAAVPGREARRWAQRAGLSVHELEIAARTALRLRMRPVLRHVKTKRSTRSAWDSVSYCGRVIPQAGISTSGGLVGGRLVRASCGLHKLCPRCAAEKSQRDAFMLRCFAGNQEGETLVVTLTQAKKARRRESCSEAIDRFTDSLRRLNSGTLPKSEPDAWDKPERWAAYWWKTMIRGAHRSIEVTYSGKDEKTRFSGFHVHAHLVVELADPDHGWMVEHYGADCPALPISPEAWDLVREEWRLFCMDRIVECWREVSPIHEKQRQEKQEYGENGTGFTWMGCHVDEADHERLYQACKYAMKPAVLTPEDLADETQPDHADSKFWALVEMYTAVQERKLQSSWGTWRNWRAEFEAPPAPEEELEIGERNVEVVTPEPEGEELPAVAEWVPLQGDLQALVMAAGSGACLDSVPKKGHALRAFDARKLLEHIQERVRCKPAEVEYGEVTKFGIAA